MKVLLYRMLGRKIKAMSSTEAKTLTKDLGMQFRRFGGCGGLRCGCWLRRLWLCWFVDGSEGGKDVSRPQRQVVLSIHCLRLLC